MVKVAINGFGRIGRMVFRAGIENPDIEWVAINDLMDAKQLAYLLKMDSVHGSLKKQIKTGHDALIIENKRVELFNEKDPENLPWDDLNIDVVIESTGLFTKKALAAKHLRAGAKKVFISAPSDDCDFMIVKGVNEHEYDTKKHHIISNASCTTNCLAPVAKVINDNYNIKRGFMTTIHAATSTQNPVDGPNKKDVRRGRSCLVNMVPTSTGAAKAVVKVIPELKGKLDAMAIRVPIINGSIIDLVAETEKHVSAEEVNNLFENVAGHHLKNVIEYSEEPIVSTDIIGNPHSAIFDASLTKTIKGEYGTIIKVLAWYDNEWGYSCRMIDLIPMLVR